MLNFKTFLLFLLPLYVQAYRRSATADARKATKLFDMRPVIDKDYRVKIPSESFCARMELKGPDFYMVMPWWYNYCNDIRDKMRKQNHFKESERYKKLRPFMAVLDRVQAYKKREKMWQKMAADLGHEINLGKEILL